MRNTFILLLITLLCVVPVAAQEAAEPAASAGPAPAAPTVIATVDSSETREHLRELLRRLPPQVGKTLKLDPTLWTNQTYLAHYPVLQAFIAAHPDVVHSPSFFLESVWIPNDPVPETTSMRMWNEMFEGITIFGVMIVMVLAVTWLIRTVIEHRRWSRLSRVQAEVHNKLLDRFASNEDLLAYVKTTAGRRFLEAAPIPTEGPRAVAAPINRVLWSVQAGIVLIAAGIGLSIISWSVEKDVAQPFSAIGTLVMATGIGLCAAAGVSFILSRKLGLLQPALPDTESEVSTE